MIVPQLQLAEESTEVLGDLEIISAAPTKFLKRTNRDVKEVSNFV